MRVFIDSTGADTAGISVAIKHAFLRHAPDWRVDSMVAAGNYINYPQDVPWSQRGLERLYDAADVVHIHNTTHAHRWYDNAQGKPTVLTHHGMHSQGDFRQMVADGLAIGATQLASTLDLALMEPGLEWVGAPVSLEAMRSLRERNYRSGRVLRIGHAPTNRAIKGTEAFIAAMVKLVQSGLPVEPVVIEGRQWADCLRIKATCDLWFDQPVLGYGSNAIEAWAMGIPVVSGVADPQIRAGMIERWGRLPFFEANEATLESGLRALAADSGLREEYRERGTAHVERWHDERVTVETLKRIYANARPSVPGGSERRLSTLTIAKLDRHAARDLRNQRIGVAR